MKEHIELLKRIQSYLPRHGVFTTNAIYVTPAQSLRNEANRIEAQERDERAFDELIKELESTP
jgi:hypothetical protein